MLRCSRLTHRQLVMRAAAFAACMIVINFQSPDTAIAQTATKVRVGGPPSISYLPYYIALEEGYFTKRGLDVSHVETMTVMPALISGELDFALGGGDNFIIAAAAGKPTPIVVMMAGGYALSILASPTLPLPNRDKGYPEKLKDLKGKTIGVPNRGTGAESLVKQAMADVGFEEGRDFSMVVLGGGGNIVSALKASRIDAALTWSPYTEQLLADKSGVSLVKEDEGQGPALRRGQAAAIAVGVNDNYLKSNPDAVKKVIAAIVEADEFNRNYTANKERLINIAIKYTGITDKTILASAIEPQARVAYPGVSCSAFQRAATALKSVNGIPKIPSCSEMIAQDIAPDGPLMPAQ